MVHGFDLDQDLHQQLRGLVPPQALEWVEQETGERVVAQAPLEGGQSAALHRLRLEGGAELVIRRLVLDWVAEEPWAAANEATVLELLRDTAVAAPQLVAVDPTGSQAAGVPTVLMTMLPGKLVWDPVLLWAHGAVTAVVDWISSCAGPPEEDIAHCPCNLARHHGQGVADEFLTRWLRATGRTEYHPYWDLLDAVSMGAGQLHPRLDQFVAAAAARL